MKKTIFVWVILVLSVISFVAELITLIGLPFAGISGYYGSHNILNVLAVILLVIDIVIMGIFIYKLFKLNKDAILWTDIEFGYSVLHSLLAIMSDVIVTKGTAVANVIEVIVIIIVWIFFRKHLRKLFKGQ